MHCRLRPLLAVLALSSVAPTPHDGAADEPNGRQYVFAPTSLGRLRGQLINTTTAVFNSIPYGAVPTGPLRYRPPRDVAPWRPRTKDVSSVPYRFKCPQLVLHSGVPIMEGRSPRAPLQLSHTKQNERTDSPLQAQRSIA